MSSISPFLSLQAEEKKYKLLVCKTAGKVYPWKIRLYTQAHSIGWMATFSVTLIWLCSYFFFISGYKLFTKSKTKRKKTTLLPNFVFVFPESVLQLPSLLLLVLLNKMSCSSNWLYPPL